MPRVHVVDDVADFVTDGDNGSLFPFSPGETTIFPTQVGFLGMTSGPGCLGKGALKPGVALAHAGRFSLAAAGLVARRYPGPSSELARGGEPVDDAAYFRHDRLGRPQADARDSVQAPDGISERAHLLGDFRVTGLDLLVEAADLVQFLVDNEAQAAFKLPHESLLEAGPILLDAPVGQVRHDLGVVLTAKQGGEHALAGGTRYIRDDAGQFDVRPFQSLLQPVDGAGSVLDERGTKPGEVAVRAESAGE